MSILRALTNSEKTEVKAAKTWVNNRIKSINHAAFKKRQPGQRNEEIPQIPQITGQPCWVRVRTGTKYYTEFALLIDYEKLRKYVSKLRPKDYRFTITAEPYSGPGRWALQLVFQKRTGSGGGRLFLHQLPADHGFLLDLQPLPTIDLTSVS